MPSLLNTTPFNKGNHFIDTKSAPEYTGRSLSWLNTLTSQGKFPKKRTLDTRTGKKIMGWFSSEIDEWEAGATSFERDRNLWAGTIQNVQMVMVGHVNAEISSYFESQIIAALRELMPVMIQGQGGYEPRAGRFLMSGYEWQPWSHIPGYPIDSFHTDTPGYQTWFTVFSDTHGHWVNFLYPKTPKIGDPIEVITPVGSIQWVHGVEGLAAFAQVHYVEWLICQKRHWDYPSSIGNYPFFNLYQVI